MMMGDAKVFVDILDWAARIQTADHAEPSGGWALGHDGIQVDWTASCVRRAVRHSYILASSFYHVIRQHHAQFGFTVDTVDKVEESRRYFAEISQRKQILIQYPNPLSVGFLCRLQCEDSGYNLWQAAVRSFFRSIADGLDPSKVRHVDSVLKLADDFCGLW
ncbi:hypothetical protein N7450_006507 [Penicillium hetheringtonii]|uniref:Uncharacterized protein n=1 Tax=Penicillium hetheringtonii TaxID=911720 RepID=A0AAD6GSX6_9EURO|nr:hypothetical protein N7450_006507 [Penicillium hetheringtonii]